MSYQGKCFYSISVKTACFAAAIVNVAVNGLLALTFLFIWGVLLDFHIPFRGDIIEWAFIQILIMFLVVLLNIIICSVLISGICNRRPKLIKAYFWYGLVITILAFGYAVLLLIVVLHDEHASSMTAKILVCWWLGCVLHSLFLVLVHFTHKKLLEYNGINSENSLPLTNQRLLNV